MSRHVRAFSAPATAPLRRAGRDLRGSAGAFGFGFVAQACSAATNFGLVVLASHALGPAGLGTLLVGFAVYLLLLGFERSLLTEPLIAGSFARAATDRVASTRAALTLGLAAALVAGAVLAAVGLALPSRIGRGIVLFGIWVVPALVQDLGRSILFRNRPGPAAVLSDATWLVVMVATAPFALSSGSDWGVVGCWGAGALAGAVVSLVQLRWAPVPIGRAFLWWKAEAWRFGRWLGLQGLLYSAATYATVVALAGVLGAREYGGLRAVQSAFAPLTLFGPALALPGLPLVSRLAAHTPRRALVTAAQLGAAITLVTGAYVVVLYMFPGTLAFVFGEKFRGFQSIVVPIGLAQVLIAPAFGLTLFLKAGQRGRMLLVLGTLNAVLYLGLSFGLASAFGLDGAAWGGVASGALGGLGLLFALRSAVTALERR